MLKFLRILGLHHVVDEGVDLRSLDAGKVIADRDVELEAVLAAETVLFGYKVKHDPRIDILVLSFRNGQLCGPLAVVTLVICLDTGLIHTGCQLTSVHLLNGLQLEESCSGIVGGDDILRKLGVGTCRRTDDGLERASEDLLRVSRIGNKWTADTEYTAMRIMLASHPVKELFK